jgi:hypothetical protein
MAEPPILLLKHVERLNGLCIRGGEARLEQVVGQLR